MFQKVAHANGKGINKTSKMRPKSIPKLIKNQYKNHARKRDTQKMKNHQQSDPKREWKKRNNQNETQAKQLNKK